MTPPSCRLTEKIAEDRSLLSGEERRLCGSTLPKKFFHVSNYHEHAGENFPVSGFQAVAIPHTTRPSPKLSDFGQSFFLLRLLLPFLEPLSTGVKEHPIAIRCKLSNPLGQENFYSISCSFALDRRAIAWERNVSKSDGWVDSRGGESWHKPKQSSRQPNELKSPRSYGGAACDCVDVANGRG